MNLGLRGNISQQKRILFFSEVYLFISETEIVPEEEGAERERERERERIPSRLRAVRAETHVGLEPTTVR